MSIYFNILFQLMDRSCKFILSLDDMLIIMESKIELIPLMDILLQTDDSIQSNIHLKKSYQAPQLHCLNAEKIQGNSTDFQTDNFLTGS